MSKFSAVARGLRAVARPLWHELPLFVVALVTWGPNTWWSLFLTSIHLHFTSKTAYILHYAGINFLWAYLLTLLCYCVARRQRGAWIKHVVAAVSWGSLLVYLFLRFNFHSNVTPQILLAIAETNGSESAEFFHTYLTAKNIGLVLFVLAAAMGVLAVDRRWQNRWQNRLRPRKQWITVVASTLCTTLLAGGIYCSHILVLTMRCSDIKQLEVAPVMSDGDFGRDNLSCYIYSVCAIRLTAHEVEQAIAHSRNELETGRDTMGEDTPTTVVVVIGESYNKHHAALYGYPLPTTPCLNAERDAGRLTVFTDVVAPWNTTSSTLKEMLSCAPTGKRWYEGALLMTVFKRAGYRVYWWDNQLDYYPESAFSFSLNSLIFNKKIVEQCFDKTSTRCFVLDHELVDDLLHTLGDTLHRGHNLVFIHLMGQHVMARQRYPHTPQWERFTASDIRPEDASLTGEQREMIAHYDNATRYNDSVVMKICNLVAGDDAVVIYAPDHGEEIYDWRDFMGRDHDTAKSPQVLRYQNEVPLMVWCSPTYSQRRPELMQSLAEAQNRPMMNTQLSALLWELADVVTPYRREEASPLSPRYVPAQRIIYGHLDYDSIMQAAVKR